MEPPAPTSEGWITRAMLDMLRAMDDEQGGIEASVRAFQRRLIGDFTFSLAAHLVRSVMPILRAQVFPPREGYPVMDLLRPKRSGRLI